MRCPYCGDEDVGPIATAVEGATPAVKCLKCGAELDPIALASEGEARHTHRRATGRIGALVAATVLVVGFGMVALRDRPAAVPTPQVAPSARPVTTAPRSSTPRAISRPTTPVSETVQVTESGRKYHRAGCRYLRRSDREMGRREARAGGYTPCSVCRP